ncbi:MAG: methyltransferase domain-containing protein [Parcubacteria group bacterium]
MRRLLNSQVKLSRAFDKLLPADMRVDGNAYFNTDFVEAYVRPGQRVWDVGSGRFPYFSLEDKKRLKLHVTGLDIVAKELAAAPKGAYDEAVTGDLTRFTGKGQADLVVSNAVLEHVRDTRAAMRAIASLLKPGGEAALFLPSRNAVFARLNIVLPEGLKRWLLQNLKPGYKGNAGWPAFYDRCTPRDFRRMAKENGLTVVELKSFYISSYFMAFFPLYVLWRVWMLLFRAVAGENAAETFCIALRKEAEALGNYATVGGSEVVDAVG